MTTPLPHRRTRRPRAATWWAVLLTFALAPSLSSAQTAPPFQGEQEVTAVDVLLEVRRAQTLFGAAPPGTLEAGEFALRWAGQARPVVGLELPDAAGAEPWEIVLYLDLVRLDEPSLRWAVALLVPQLETLTRLGAVQLVLADPLPRTVVSATRDVEVLSEALSRTALFPASRDLLAELRQDLIEALDEAATAEEAQELAAAIEAAEAALVRRRQDDLLLHLLAAPPPSARRALVWVSGGVDLQPSGFYRGAVFSGPAEAPAPELVPVVEELARTLAGYGWITLQVLPPEPDPRAGLKPGWRLGKWRLRGLGAVYEDEREPAKASAFLAIGENLHRQGQLAEAAEAYRKAVHHFYGDPRTAVEQARAFTGLGQVLTRLGDREQAERAFEAARTLDPDGAGAQLGGRPGGVARFDPTPAAELVAATTAGATARNETDLRDALASLGRRVRLTFQVSGPATGSLEPLEVTLDRPGLRLGAPTWARFGTPDTIAAAQLRHLLAPDQDQPPPRGDIPLELTTNPEGIPLTARWPQLAGDVRVSVAQLDEDGELTVRHHRLTTTEAGPSYNLPSSTPGTIVALAVRVEELASGRWGVAVWGLAAETVE